MWFYPAMFQAAGSAVLGSEGSVGGLLEMRRSIDLRLILFALALIALTVWANFEAFME